MGPVVRPSPGACDDSGGAGKGFGLVIVRPRGVGLQAVSKFY
jgi:hypothetical protein